MMIALPNPDRSFTCTLFWPNSGTSSFASIGSPAAVERHFAEHYPDLVELAPDPRRGLPAQPRRPARHRALHPAGTSAGRPP